ncbi:interferon-gamma-inducible GTPase 10-like isoform X2 [Hypanus sabinus]|uniref:interferon-gamma-inducible GTPase 10-like isoform X1 n=1 Tax=Hypanus sabinus TaxID=79690 RepID=UPI0028C46393|nr:interferon-gamma-inducible GTPase 10-like isoform X1 [Hypanus sabinus]XP_059813463.1 interferon-gamma-inducible GTPase 10-like isoform X2 [Hypanus sabinus]
MEEMIMFFYDLLLATISYLRPEPSPATHCPRKSSGGRRGPCSQPRDRRPINVAVTGPVGSGKSTLVRAMLRDAGAEVLEEEEAADSSDSLRSFVFPDNPRVLLWDLPGIEADDSAPWAPEEPGLAAFDFFILTSGSRLNEKVLQLARDIERTGRLFFFVRTKVDDYVRQTQQTSFPQAQLLREIRRHFSKGLQAAGVQAPRVFLLSALEPRDYDFPDFMQAFRGEFSTRD